MASAVERARARGPGPLARPVQAAPVLSAAAEQRAIDASLIAYRVRTETALSRGPLALCALGAALLAINWTNLGWPLTSRALLPSLIASAYWGIGFGPSQSPATRRRGVGPRG